MSRRHRVNMNFLTTSHFPIEDGVNASRPYSSSEPILFPRELLQHRTKRFVFPIPLTQPFWAFVQMSSSQ